MVGCFCLFKKKKRQPFQMQICPVNQNNYKEQRSDFCLWSFSFFSFVWYYVKLSQLKILVGLKKKKVGFFVFFPHTFPEINKVPMYFEHLTPEGALDVWRSPDHCFSWIKDVPLFNLSCFVNEASLFLKSFHSFIFIRKYYFFAFNKNLKQLSSL